MMVAASPAVSAEMGSLSLAEAMRLQFPQFLLTIEARWWKAAISVLLSAHRLDQLPLARGLSHPQGDRLVALKTTRYLAVDPVVQAQFDLSQMDPIVADDGD